MNPLSGIIKYLPIYIKYSGKKTFLLFVISSILIFVEGVGLTMVMPLFSVIDGSGPPENQVGLMFYNILSKLGWENNLIAILVLIGSIFILKGLIFIGEGIFRSLIRVRMYKKLKSSMYKSFTLMNYEYYAKKDTGHFINIFNEQINNFVLSFNGMVNLLSNMFMGFGYIFFSFLISWQIALLSIIIGFSFFYVFKGLNNWVHSLSRMQASEAGSLSKLIVQVIQSFKYSASTGQLTQLGKGILDSIDKLSYYQVRSYIASTLSNSVREPLTIIFVLSIIGFQVGYLESKIIPIMVILLMFHRSLGHIFEIQGGWQNVLTLIGSVEIVDNEFNNLKIFKEPGGNLKLENINSGIELENVSFKYDKSDSFVLQDVNLNFPINQTVAVIGESGAGKSTLIDLITLMLKPTNGIVKINGVKSKEIDLLSWRENIGYVSQETIIFNDTIANNICLWDDSNDVKSIKNNIKLAARNAYIDKFIGTLPDGYDTLVGDRGIRLSGGQRQRLFIARELYKNPKLLILDEATSSLDSESEMYIQKSIDSLKGKMMVVIIAHRLSTIRNVDFMYVLAKGKLLESGSFEELLNRKNSKFNQMVQMQVI